LIADPNAFINSLACAPHQPMHKELLTESSEQLFCNLIPIDHQVSDLLAYRVS